jgi:hypothetical protein
MAFAYGGDQYKDLWNATKAEYSSKLIDMLPRSHPLLAKIAGNNNVKAKTLKGKRFVEPILARCINNVKGIDYRSEISTDEAQLTETIEVEPKLLYQGVTVYDKVLAVNNSNELIDLLSINHKAVREGFARAFAKNIYGTGAPDTTNASASYNMNGVGYMISENPYAKDLVAFNLLRGLSLDSGNDGLGGTQEFWRNRCGQWVIGNDKTDPMTWVEGDKDGNAKKLIDTLTMTLLVLNGVSEVSALEKISPVIDCIFMNYSFYNLFAYAKYQILHINNVPEQKIDLGFTKLEHMGVPIYLDKNCPMNKIYCLDSSQIDLLYIPGENFKQQVLDIPTHLAKRYITTFMGNYIIHKARNCAVLTLNTTDNGLNKTDYDIGASAKIDLTKVNLCNADAYVDYDYDATAPTAFSDSIENSGYSGTGRVKSQPSTPTPSTTGESIN